MGGLASGGEKTKSLCNIGKEKGTSESGKKECAEMTFPGVLKNQGRRGEEKGGDGGGRLSAAVARSETGIKARRDAVGGVRRKGKKKSDRATL